MRRISFLAAFALPLLLIEATPAHAQVYGNAGGYGGSATGGYYRQSLYQGNPAPFLPPFNFAMRMYPLIHFHGPLVNYGPYEGYYPFQPYGPWTSDLKYSGPPIPKHPHFANGNSGSAGTGWIWGGHSHGNGSCGHSHGWGHYALATFHNVGLRTHPGKHGCKNCTAFADVPSDIVTVENVAVVPSVPAVRER